MGAVETIAINLLSSSIYEIVKRTGKKIIENDISFEDEIKEKVASSLDSIDSSGIVAFMQLQSTSSYIYNYIRLISYTGYTKNIKVNYVSSSEFVDTLTGRAYDYIQVNKYNLPEKKDIEAFFSELLSLLENKLIDDLPKELIAIPYFMKQAIEQLSNAIRESSVSVSISEVDYDSTKKEYLNIIKDIFRKNQVPGIDRLEFSDYYIHPRFSYHFPEQKTQKYIQDVEKDVDNVKWIDMFKLSNFISVVGGPGYGKTLLLKNLVINYDKLNINNSNTCLPIYCNLKEFIESKRTNKFYSLEDFLVESIISLTGMDNDKINKNFIKNYLERGECVIFLDALDEVETPERLKLSNLIVGFFKNSNNNNKVCITTRDRSLIPDTPIVLRIENINEVELSEYLTLMTKINEFNENDITPFINQCKPLIRTKFLKSFLTVALMVRIYKADRKIPENKIELYEKCVNYISKEREKEKNVGFDFDLMNSIINNEITFERLALLGKRNNKEVSKNEIVEILMDIFSKRYIDVNQANLAINHFLEFCQERTELYVQGNKEDHFKFFHRSFFEFFYVKYIVKNINGPTSLFNEIIKFNSDSEMNELLISYLKINYYEKYIKFMDLAFKKFIDGSNNLRINEIVTEFVYLSDEHEHLVKYYSIIFNDNRIAILNESRVGFGILANLVIRMSKFNDFFEKVISTVPELLMSSLIRTQIKVTDSYKLYSDSFLDFIFYIHFNEIFNKFSNEIEEYLAKMDFEFFWENFGSHLEIMNNETRVLESVDEDLSKVLFKRLKKIKIKNLRYPYLIGAARND